MCVSMCACAICMCACIYTYVCVCACMHTYIIMWMYIRLLSPPSSRESYPVAVVRVASAKDLKGEEEEQEEGGEEEEESEGLRLAYSVEEVVSRKTYNKFKNFPAKIILCEERFLLVMITYVFFYRLTCYVYIYIMCNTV